MKDGLTQERLKELLDYNPDTGVFTWKVTIAKAKKGNVAGMISKKDGYVRIGIDKKTYLAHRLAWLYQTGTWPDSILDHIDNVRHNNTWNNIRLANHVLNAQKSIMRSDNKSGYTGVHYNKNRNRFCSRITVNKKIINLGSFKDFGDAVKARKDAETKYGFGLNHGTNKLPNYRNEYVKSVQKSKIHKGSKKDFPIDRIKELIDYNPKNGNFYWKVDTRQSEKGSIAGTKTELRHNNQYIRIQLDGVKFKGHELAYLIKLGRFPKGIVDHIDHNGLNNSWENLREIEHSENVKNRSLSSKNRTGYHGIHIRKSDGKYVARINNLEGVRVYLGTFDNLEDAVRVRKEAEVKYNYHPNHGK